MTLWDISPPLTPDIAVWPGDTPLSREVLCDIARGDNLTLSTLRATVHLGAHADAPSHYGDGAPAIDAVSLEPYLGPCQVLEVHVPAGGTVPPEAVVPRLAAPRVLLRTGSFPDPRDFREDFVALAPGLVDALADRGVVLVGLDTPSVDPFASKELPAHGRLLAHGMAVLEGLVLDGVPEGRYELIALPLRLVGFDASPVRAVLRSLDEPVSRPSRSP
ncbi:MAG: kynurenine formamidase [Acidobacteria bacterium]|nr:MAG: kynurenine formamidase [Acidobacteriota bacterium]